MHYWPPQINPYSKLVGPTLRPVVCVLFAFVCFANRIVSLSLCYLFMCAVAPTRQMIVGWLTRFIAKHLCPLSQLPAHEIFYFQQASNLRYVRAVMMLLPLCALCTAIACSSHSVCVLYRLRAAAVLPITPACGRHKCTVKFETLSAQL